MLKSPQTRPYTGAPRTKPSVDTRLQSIGWLAVALAMATAAFFVWVVTGSEPGDSRAAVERRQTSRSIDVDGTTDRSFDSEGDPRREWAQADLEPLWRDLAENGDRAHCVNGVTGPALGECG